MKVNINIHWTFKYLCYKYIILSITYFFFLIGPNCLTPWKSQEAEVGDLPSKVLLHYTPKV